MAITRHRFFFSCFRYAVRGVNATRQFHSQETRGCDTIVLFFFLSRFTVILPLSVIPHALKDFQGIVFFSRVFFSLNAITWTQRRRKKKSIYIQNLFIFRAISTLS